MLFGIRAARAATAAGHLFRGRAAGAVLAGNMPMGSAAPAATAVRRALAAPRRCATGTAGAASPYAQVEPSDLEFFRDVLGGAGVVTEPEAVAPHNSDWMGTYHGHATVVLRPGSTEDVAAVLRHCNQRRIAVVPQGGNTGLVGGSVPVRDEVVLSLSRLNDVLDFDAGSGVLVCGAGCVLEQLDEWVGQRGYTMPLDLGAKGSCQIGGNAATNAGGLRYLRYGSLHGSILGLEVVKADGTVLDCLTTLRKDNVGYDLKQLFIGSEGTLGVITKVAIQVAPRPAATRIALLACDSFESVCDTLATARKHLAEVLSAAEFVDRSAMSMVLEYVEGARDPLESPHPFYVLLETRGSRAAHDQEKLDAFLEDAMASDAVLDGVVAQDGVQARALWSLREDVAVGLGRAGRVYKYDLSLPQARMYELVEVTRERVADRSDATVVGYGHLGDCNLHLNVSTPTDAPCLRDRLEPFLFEWTAAAGGSLSAEHGLGQSKAKFMGLQRSPEVIAVMRQVKEALDPNGILNPYKVLVG